MKTAHHTFKTFPEFSKLTLADRERYESLVADYPAVSDISFPTLMTWWSQLDNCSVAQLNGNLVISYWLPGMERVSGLSLIGTDDVDESICTILDELKAQGEEPRLVHVPEFVVSSLRFPELYTFADERDQDECILDVAALQSLGTMIKHKRWKIRRFLAEIEEDRVEVKRLDLDVSENQQQLLDGVAAWQQEGTLNDFGRLEREVAKTVIKHAEALGLENSCVYIDGELHSFLLYSLPGNPDYGIVHCARFSFAMPHLFEFVAYRYAQWFADLGLKYVNIEVDLGLPAVRAAKLGLGPANFFRKYTIEPKN